MKITKTTIMASVMMLTMVGVPTEVSAQKFLNKIKAGAKSLTGGSKESSETDTAQATRTIDWSKAPVYKAKRVERLDAKGKVMLNADGTPILEVRLFDQFGNMASEETVKAQHAAIKKSGNTVLKNVGITTALGVLDGLKNGTLLTSSIIGTVSGVAVSAGDLKTIYEQKKSLKQQEKELAAYSKNFTSEGTPKNAQIDLTNVDGIDYTKEEPVKIKDSDYKKIINSEAFNSTDTSAWDI